MYLNFNDKDVEIINKEPIDERCPECSSVKPFIHFDCKCCGRHNRVCLACSYTEEIELRDKTTCGCGKNKNFGNLNVNDILNDSSKN